MKNFRALALGLVLAAWALPALAQAQAYDSIDTGAGYHVTYHGWSEDGWVHWQQECYAEGCGQWYIVSVGW